jgi:hypothetical protein
MLWDEFAAGASKDQLADRFGVSAERVRQILEEVRTFDGVLTEVEGWRLRDSMRPVTHLKLSTRTSNILRSECVITLQELGKFLAQEDAQLRRVPSAGRVSVAELRSIPLSRVLKDVPATNLSQAPIRWSEYVELKHAGVVNIAELARALEDFDHYDERLFTPGLLDRLQSWLQHFKASGDMAPVR